MLNKLTLKINHLLDKHHYFDEYGNEIFPQVGEEYIMLDGSIKKFPF